MNRPDLKSPELARSQVGIQETTDLQIPSAADQNPSTPEANQSKAGNRARMRRLTWSAIGILLIVTIGYGAYSYSGRIGGGKTDIGLTFTVDKRTLRDTVVERGTLESQETVQGICQVPGGGKIIFIAPEGASVQKGDDVVRFDTENIDKVIAEKKVQVNEAQLKVEKAKQEIKVKENESDSLVSDAEFKLTQAKLALEKYVDGDYQSQLAELNQAVSEGESELERSVDQLQNFRALVKKGIRSPEQLREIELQVDGHRHRVIKAQRDLEVLKKFTYKEQITTLEHNVKDGELKLARAKTTAKAQVSQAKAEVARAERGLKIQQQELNEKIKAKEKCVIKAPQPGTVAYANQPWYNPEDKIREGSEAYNGKAIFNLPDMSRMQVKVSVHESVVTKIAVDQQASIRIDAFPDFQFRGTVKKVSQLASSAYYQTTQNYEVIVNIDEIPEGVSLKPGMTAEVECLVGVYKDVLAIPITTVTESYGQSYVFKKQGNEFVKQKIEIGRVTTSFIEVLDGLSDGNILAMDAYQRGLQQFGKEEQTAEPESSQPPGLQEIAGN